MRDVRLTLTRKEVAAALGIGLTKVDQLLRRTENPIPSVRLGRKILVPCAMFEAWLARLAEGASGAEE